MGREVNIPSASLKDGMLERWKNADINILKLIHRLNQNINSLN